MPSGRGSRPNAHQPRVRMGPFHHQLLMPATPGSPASTCRCSWRCPGLGCHARRSSLAQVAGLEAQERELRAVECDRIFPKQVSSVAQRQQLEAALDYVREGDSFSVTKLDRLARSVGDLLVIVARLETKRVSLRVLSMSGNQALGTSASTGRLMLSVIAAVGQAEREGMLERQREGIVKAKREGRCRGRVPTARRQAMKPSHSATSKWEVGRNLVTGEGGCPPVRGKLVSFGVHASFSDARGRLFLCRASHGEPEDCATTRIILRP